MAHPRVMRGEDGRTPHIHLREDEVARYVLLPGSPERARLTASTFDEVKEVAFNREYLSFTGKYQDIDVTVMSTGMGVFSAVTAVEELVDIGADTFIRIGSCATFQKEIALGDNIIPTGCIRDEGCTIEFAPLSFPALPDFEVLTCLIESAKEVGAVYHTGVARTCENFYLRERSTKLNEQYARLGAVALEMELSAILMAATDLGKRAGGILTVGSNLVTTENRYKGQRVAEYEAGERNMIRIALETIKRLDGR